MPSELPLEPLLDSWLVALRSERRAPATLVAYERGVRQFMQWCDAAGRPRSIDRDAAREWIAELLERGMEPSTARARQSALKRFSKWLAEEGERPSDPLLGLKPPRLDTKLVEPLSDDELRRMVATCKGGGFTDRRDEAILRLFMETGMRAGELISLTVDDVDLQAGIARVLRSKTHTARSVPFGPVTAKSLDRYLRARMRHPRSSGPALWLGGQGKAGFTYSAMWYSLGERAKRAGITGFHPHRMRHTAAHRWLAAGGSEGGLMAVAGWSDPSMLARYSRARAAERAAAEARSLNLGEL